jgi:predicted nucleic acid-binding protein
LTADVRVLVDANVLVPTILREIVLGAAASGRFAPLWSARILEEWARATRRLPPGAEALARAGIERLRADWPDAEVPADPDLEARLSLPDPADRHVLAAAIGGGAGVILTRNRSDFPPRTLARHGVVLREPDGFLCDLADDGADIAAIAGAVLQRAEAISGEPRSLRAMLKRATLPRLARRLAPREEP